MSRIRLAVKQYTNTETGTPSMLRTLCEYANEVSTPTINWIALDAVKTTDTKSMRDLQLSEKRRN